MANYFIVVDGTPEAVFFEAGWENDGMTGVTFIAQGAYQATAVETFIKKIKGSHVIRKATTGQDVSGISSTSTLQTWLDSYYSTLTFSIVSA